MKRILFLSCVMVMNLYAAASHWTGPIVSGTKAQGDGANVATSSGEIFANGDIEADGDLNIAGTSTLSGNVTITGDVSIDGVINNSMSSVIQISTATALVVTDRYMLIIGSITPGGAFAVISDATPFISTTTATDGDIVTIIGTDATGTLQLSDTGTVSGTLLELDGTTIVLGEDSNITLLYYEGKWIQVGGINTID